jgi:N-methylhydantoinase A/oxoprolinase/acetone carboxylase beta subunit
MSLVENDGRRRRYRLGCDVGGTFTDFVLLDEMTGTFEIGKVLTTPKDPSEGIENGVAQLLIDRPGFLATTDNVIHGTTLVINAVIERTGAATALLTTQGFRDILEMRREIRYDMYDLGARYPVPLVERRHRREVVERIHPDGRVLRPFDAVATADVIRGCVTDAIESIAVCLLHAYANPAHERKVRDIAAEVAPHLTVSLSSEVLPERREFERTSATVLNAYVKPLVARYLARLEERLSRLGLGGRLYLILSGGGITSTETAREFPVRLIESGPVGGAVAALHLAGRAGLRDIISFDMGGTTAKACLIRDGLLEITKDLEVDRVHRFKRGSGHPTAVPSVDLIEIGAGGGSLAGIGKAGVLEVGPQSSGADPGPICYGRGGRGPTVTDADLVLGYLDPGYFLGGAMRLDVEGAKAGIDREVGRPLELSTVEAAYGIHEVVNENMASAIRMHVSERGGDLRHITLVAFGGAGPVHAWGVARSLGIPRLLVPRGAGVLSALGFLVAPVSFESSRTRPSRLSETNAPALDQVYAELEREAGAVVGRAAPGSPVTFTRSAEMSYAGQLHHIRVALGDSLSGALDVTRLGEAFDAEYRRLYGLTYEHLEIQIVTLIVTATAVKEMVSVATPFPLGSRDGQRSLKGRRPAYDPTTRAFVPHVVHAMDDLEADTTIEGPAIIEERASTLVVGTGGVASVDERGWIMITLPGEQA